MKKVLYHILALPVYAFLLLPFPVFYFVSDLLFLLGYYVIGYRKKVIYANLRNAFPDKTQAEIQVTGKKYYRFMIDLFLETFKVLVMTPEELHRRYTFSNIDLLDEFIEKKQSVIFVLGHYGNWEWCGQSFQLKHMMQQDVLYHQLSSGFFEWLTYKLRSRFGILPIPMQASIKEMVRRKDMLTATAFVADQTPSNTDSSHWMTFLNQDTPVFLGTEKIAKKLNRPVIFVHIQKLRRGYYETYLTLVSDSPKDTPDYWITEQHTRLLEADIVKRPELWLWSHRRWKHKRSGANLPS